MKTAKLSAILSIIICLTLSACEQKTANDDIKVNTGQKTEAKPLLNAQKLSTANNNLFAEGEKAIDGSTEAAQDLAVAIHNFLSSPTQENLTQAQQHLIATSLAYRKFFFAKQIALVDPGSFAQLNKADFRIGTYPIQPGFIDAFGEYKYSGMVFDAGFELTKESLSHQHGLTDVSEVVLGIYAMEFLLFNVDGKRQIEDFIPAVKLSQNDKDKGYQKAAELPNNRRREILRLQAEILLDDLRGLKDIWLSEEFTRGSWLALSANKQIVKAKHTLTNSLTNIMVEIGDINSEAVDNRELTVPPNILNNTLTIKRQYLINALESCRAGILFLGEEGKLKEKKQRIEKLMREEITYLSENEDKKEFWQTSFSNLKRITEAVLTF